MKTSMFLGQINVFRRFGSSRWRQVGVIIGLFGEKPDNIKTRWLGEFDLEEFPRVLAGPGRLLRDVPSGLGGPVGREGKGPNAPRGSDSGFVVTKG
jgi:hypothetical protein